MLSWLRSENLDLTSRHELARGILASSFNFKRIKITNLFNKNKKLKD